MDRVQRLWEHPLYQEQFQKLQQSEKQRIFCNHTLAHFLDVARLTYIYSLESGAGLDRELIYAAALLHDIGRWQQISKGIPHDEAGAALTGQLLPACGFDHTETATIQNAILHHRVKLPASEGQSHTGPESEDLCSARSQCEMNTQPHRSPEYMNQSDAPPPHSTQCPNQAAALAFYLRQADKRSRCCFACDAARECNWSEEQKNHHITL